MHCSSTAEKRDAFVYYDLNSCCHQLIGHKQIEHAQHLVPGSTIRFGEQRIIASVQVNRRAIIYLFLHESLSWAFY